MANHQHQPTNIYDYTSNIPKGNQHALQRIQRILPVLWRRRNIANQEAHRVSTKRVLENPRQLGVPVRNTALHDKKKNTIQFSSICIYIRHLSPPIHIVLEKNKPGWAKRGMKESQKGGQLTAF